MPELASVFGLKGLLAIATYATVAVQVVACGLGADTSAPGEPALPEGVFESDDPTKLTPGAGGGLSADAGASTGGSSGEAGSSGTGGTAGSGGDPAKLIEEADIIQLQGSTLYALSQYSGLSIIDVSVKDELKLLGSRHFDGMPLEMYVRDGVVFAMFSSLGHYVGTGGNWSWEQTGAVVALDVTNPAKIQELAEFGVPGEVSDSRIVGDVLYVVSHEDGYCYGCNTDPGTTVISLDVKQPSQPLKIDEVMFLGNGYDWGKRSVLATTDRLYIAGPESGDSDASDVQIVDISDPTGKLVKGASFAVAGVIDSRWQMDELNGVFRVVSQPPGWGSIPPRVQTFSVQSSLVVTPLGSLEMTLPVPERLRSVRFDGTRAYAITFQQTDPLFTLDLADPAAPKQLGELVIPGWVYHMEPRGDRLLALGYDNQNPAGALNVSLFDVADMTNPKLLDRVAFGGDWGDFAEDQDRIHKAFTILDSLGLIFVPFSGWVYEGYDGYGCGSYESGIKIVEFTKDDLVARGVAPAKGRARRAFLHQERLFGVSDVSVETFDITNRDAPVSKASVEISLNVSQTVQVGNKIARLGASYWTKRATLDVTTLDAVEETNTSALLELDGGKDCWYGGWYGARMFTNGTRLYVLRSGALHVVDLGGPVPVVLGEIQVPDPAPADPYGGYAYDFGYGYYSPTLLDVSAPAVNMGDTIVIQRRFSTWNADYTHDERAWLIVVDASDPKQPNLTTLERPKSIGFNGLALAGGEVVSTRWIPSPTTKNKVRFYMDRLDLSDAKAPKLLQPVNLPGSLVAVSGDGSRVITADYERVVEHATSWEDCYAKWGYPTFEPGNGTTGTCTGFRRTANLLDLGEKVLLRDAQLLPTTVRGWDVTAGDDRVYFGVDSGSYGSGASGYEAAVVSGLEAGELSVTSLAVPLGTYGYVSQLIPQGKRVFFVGGYPASITPVDMTDVASPEIAQSIELDAYSLSSVTVVGDTAICSLGEFGVTTVDLTP